MKKENVVRKSEYDRYFIPIPFSKLLGERKKKYIFSELEKRHPCFSSKYCFDSRVRLGKKGILSDVIVMDRGKYSAYRKRGGIYFEGLKFKRFRKDFIFIIFPLLLLLLGVLVVLTQSKAFENTSSYETPSVLDSDVSVVLEKQGADLSSGEESLYASGLLVKDIFACIEESNGKISLLNWGIREGGEFVSVQVNDMSPDPFFDFKDELSFDLSAVSYDGDRSSFSFSCERGIRGFSENEVPEESLEIPYQKEIRDLLLTDNCYLIEEKFFPYSIRFKFCDLTIFKRLSELLKKRILAVRDVRVQIDDSAFLMAEIYFEENKNFESGLNLSLLGDFKGAFDISKRSFSDGSKKVVEKEGFGSKKTGTDEKLKKIGEVRHADGSSLIFYKDEKGKVIKKEGGKRDEEV